MKAPLLHSARRGFTLIEMLVAIAIILVITGGGIAALITFRERQQVATGAKELQGHLRFAQSLARVGEKPAGCDKLEGYQLTAVNQSSDILVTINADCELSDVERETHLLSDLNLTSNLDVVFKVLHGGASVDTNVEVNDTDASTTFTFSISSGGDISQGEFVSE